MDDTNQFQEVQFNSEFNVRDAAEANPKSQGVTFKNVDRASKDTTATTAVVPIKINSNINVYSPPSSSSTEPYTKSNFFLPPKLIPAPIPVPLDHHNRLVHEIINKIFDERSGYIELSSSQCSTVRRESSEYSFDKRLKYWKNMLDERKNIAAEIKDKTGKQNADVLFNRQTTVDERNKQTVKRVIDYADRLNPIKLRDKKKATLKEYDDHEQCRHINELEETWPRAELEKKKIVEVSGLPSVAMEEMLGRRREMGAVKKSHWLQSDLLLQRIEHKRKDIERVVEYYPDIQNLQIVGESLIDDLDKRDSEILKLDDEEIDEVTDVSGEEEEECSAETGEREGWDNIEYGIKINDQIFRNLAKRSGKDVEIEKRFECEPFEKQIKLVMHIENIGNKVLSFDWAHKSFYQKSNKLLVPTDEEFIFDRKPFRLTAGSCTEIIVQYQPRFVGLVKDKWHLKVEPHLFCRKADSIMLKLQGKCKAPPEYVARINEIRENIIDKSNLKMVRQLTGGLAAILPLVQPPDCICPYKRTLNERELFESLNTGYKCDRFHDLELLKDLYKRIKKPRDHAWDFNLETLKAMILKQDNAEKRALLFNELLSVLDDMKGTPIDIADKMLDPTEHDRSRFLFVRGIICTGIDEWEDVTLTVEEAFLKTAFAEYFDSLMHEEEQEEEDAPPTDLYIMDEVAIREKLLKKMHHNKPFRDALYIQTYTHLCNLIENIVSVIESTDAM